MRYLTIAAILFLSACSKEPTVEVPTNTLVSSASFTVGSNTQTYNNFLVEQPSGFNYRIYSIPSTSPLLKIQATTLRELDSINVKSQNVKFTYTIGVLTYVADDQLGEGYIKCVQNKNSEYNVTIRDGSGNLKSALKREENFDARFTARLVNPASPTDQVVITNGKLTRSGRYYVY
jgi:hypothetical protein